MIPNSVAAALPRPRRADLGDAPVVMAVGRLVEQKNHARFVAAAAEVAAARPDARFVIVGDGPLRGALEAQVSGARPRRSG